MKLSHAIKKYRTFKDRIVIVKLSCSPVKVNISNCKIPIVMGNFNAEVGKEDNDQDLRNIIGKLSIGKNYCDDIFIPSVRQLFAW